MWSIIILVNKKNLIKKIKITIMMKSFFNTIKKTMNSISQYESEVD